MLGKRKWVLCLCVVGLPIFLFAQKGPKPSSNLKKQIQLTDQLLRETQGQTQRSLAELKILDRQIELRKELIDAFSIEIEQSEEQIFELNDITVQMEKDIEELVANYAKTAQLTYKSFYSDNFWLALFSSQSLAEAYYRGVYFRQYSKFRKDQVNLIQKTKTYLIEKRSDLQTTITRNKELISQKTNEVELLRESQAKQKRTYQKLKKEATGYQRTLARHRAKLKSLIGKAEAEFGGLAVIEDTDRERSFARNKGYHSWPVPTSKAIIIGKYGKITDAHGNQYMNDGVYIRTPKGQSVRSIYGGTIMMVREIPLSGTTVIIEHGKSYRTVYANLDQVRVKEGEKVKTNQPLGTVRTDERNGETTLHFLVYKHPETFENPEKWIVNVNK